MLLFDNHFPVHYVLREPKGTLRSVLVMGNQSPLWALWCAPSNLTPHHTTHAAQNNEVARHRPTPLPSHGGNGRREEEEGKGEEERAGK